MYYNKSLVKMKVKSRLNDTFVGIISDIPSSELNPSGNVLIVSSQNSLMTYEQFYNVIYKCVLEYIPRENENPLIKAIRMLPKAITNVQRIKNNNEIIKKQNEILDKYFYTSGDNNIKEKLQELERDIDQLIEDKDLDILERVLLNFDDRIRSGLLTDLEILSQLLAKR